MIKLTPQEVSKCRKISEQAKEIEEKITSHMSEIIKLAYSMYGKNLDWWDWEHHEDEGALDFRWNQVGDQTVYYTTVAQNNWTNLWCDYEGKTYDLASEFPTPWLYESIVDIMVVMEEGIEKAKARARAEKREKAKQDAAEKEARNALKKQAKAKLSAEEREALGV